MRYRSVAGILLKKVLPVVVGLVALVWVAAWLSGLTAEKIPPGQNEVVASHVTPEGRQEVYVVREVFKDYTAEAVGTLKASSRTEVSSRVLAPINKILVRAGQAVKEGDVLVELDRRALETQLSQAKAAVAAAEAAAGQAANDYGRAKRLFEKHAVSQAAMEKDAAAVEVTRAKLDQARQAQSEVDVMISYTTIKAPQNGMVVDRLAEEGDMARPGEPLLILYDPTSLRLEVPVMENLAVGLKPGDELTVQIDARDNRRIKAVVDEIVPQAEAASRSFLVKVRLPRSEDLFEGMFGRLIIPVGQRRHLCIHTGAIETIGQLQFVNVLGEGGRIERRLITTGRFGDANHREVLSGLKAGERVLLKSQPTGKPSHDQ